MAALLFDFDTSMLYTSTSIDPHIPPPSRHHGNDKPTPPPPRQIPRPTPATLLHQIPTAANSTRPLPTTKSRTNHDSTTNIALRPQRRINRNNLRPTLPSPSGGNSKLQRAQTPPLPPLPQPFNGKLARAHLLAAPTEHPLQTGAETQRPTPHATVSQTSRGESRAARRGAQDEGDGCWAEGKGA